jgi:hypothetical protein
MIYFDKSGEQYVEAPYTLPVAEGTIEGWFEVKSLYNYNTLWENNGDANKWESWVYDTGLIAVKDDSITLKSLAITAGDLVHVAHTWKASGSSTKLYINGMLAASGIHDPISSGTIFRLGGKDNMDSHFTGKNFRIWSEERTAEQIANNKSAVLSGDEPNLELYWKLDETTGTTAVDSSPNGNDGTVNGNATWVPEIDPADWDDYKELMIDSAKISADLLGYPAMVKLDSDNFDFSAVLFSGFDIVFTDEQNNLLPFEMEYFDKTLELAVFHVRVPKAEAAVDTKFRMHYGKSVLEYQYDFGTEEVTWNAYTDGSWTGALSKETDHLKIAIAGSSGALGGFVTDELVDLTDIETLSANVDLDIAASRIFELVVTTSKTDPHGNSVLVKEQNDEDFIGDFELDVSALTGSYYLAVQARVWSGTGDQKVYSVKVIPTSFSNKTGTWDPNFVGVWHLGENLEDSTANLRHGTNFGTTEVAGVNGRSRSFTGTQYAGLGSIGTWAGRPVTAATVSLISYRNANQDAAPSFKGARDGFFLMNYDASPNAKCYMRAGGSWVTASYALTETPVATNYLNTMTYDKVNLKAIVNAVVKGTTASTADIDHTTQDTRLGRYNTGYFTGKMEELRISNIVRSEAWMEADDYGLRLNTLLTISTPTPPTSAPRRRFVQLI